MKVAIDPVQRASQFKIDLAAMAVGQKKNENDKPQQRMLAKNFGVSEHKYRSWSATLTETQTFEDALQPAFWSGQAEAIMGFDKVSPKGLMDIIELRKPDTMDYWKLLVVGVGKGFIKVRPIDASVSAVLPEVPEDTVSLTTRWNVGRNCHEIISTVDRQVVSSGFQSKDDAVAEIEKLTKARAA